MTDYEEEIRKNLAADWGNAAPFSDYKVSDILRYRLPDGSTCVHLIGDTNSPYKKGKEQDHQANNTCAIAYIVQE
jgi:hypothetical protein